MKEKLRIHGGARLEGEVTVSGGKNAAVAILPAALLGDSPSVIENVPDINDVHIIIDMLAYLGAHVEFKDNVVTIDPRTADKFDPPYDLACQMRASYYFAPVLLGVFKRAEVPLPGGCDLGARPIDQTLKGLRPLGASAEILGGTLVAEIEPRCQVLPILGKHFCARMPGESFLIYDRTHRMALLCSGGCCQIFPLERLELPKADGREQLYRKLWTRFYDTVSIESRYNPQCRMTHMPKRYWAMMTEFQPENQAAALPEHSGVTSEKFR